MRYNTVVLKSDYTRESVIAGLVIAEIPSVSNNSHYHTILLYVLPPLFESIEVKATGFINPPNSSRIA